MNRAASIWMKTTNGETDFRPSNQINEKQGGNAVCVCVSVCNLRAFCPFAFSWFLFMIAEVGRFFFLPLLPLVRRISGAADCCWWIGKQPFKKSFSAGKRPLQITAEQIQKIFKCVLFNASSFFSSSSFSSAAAAAVAAPATSPSFEIPSFLFDMLTLSVSSQHPQIN